MSTEAGENSVTEPFGGLGWKWSGSLECVMVEHGLSAGQPLQRRLVMDQEN